MSTSSPAAETVDVAPQRARIAIGHLARIAFGLVFLSAAVTKSVDPSLFAEQIVEFGVTPEAWASWLAPLFIALEWLLGVALVVNFRPRLTIPAGALLILVFVGALLLAMRGGYSGACGCFGGSSSRGPVDALIEDAVFLGLALAAWVGMRAPPGLDARGHHRWQAAAVLLALVAGVLAPRVGASLPIPAFATSARAGGAFDHVVLEELGMDLHEGRYVVVILDAAEPPPDDGAFESIDTLAGTEGLPPVIGAFQGDNESMVTFLFEHAPSFEGVGHAPRAALRRFYRRLPVVLALDSGVIRAAWHETIPTGAEVLATFAAP